VPMGANTGDESWFEAVAKHPQFREESHRHES
jgi:hypothetical protein